MDENPSGDQAEEPPKPPEPRPADAGGEQPKANPKASPGTRKSRPAKSRSRTPAKAAPKAAATAPAKPKAPARPKAATTRAAAAVPARPKVPARQAAVVAGAPKPRFRRKIALPATSRLKMGPRVVAGAFAAVAAAAVGVAGLVRGRRKH